MKILISPAKSLNLTSEIPFDGFTSPIFLKQTNKIISKLKEMSVRSLGNLLGVSEKLAQLNWNRNQNFKLSSNLNSDSSFRPCIYSFDGDVYSGFDAYSVSASNIKTMQNNLRILSGLYGILKPLDLIQPYRLEMGTKIKLGGSKQLHEFWIDLVTDNLNSELSSDDILLNLASKEYFNAIDSNKIDAQIISPIFKDYSNGKLKIISFYAKKARGLMARYVIDNNSKNLKQVLGFNSAGYAFSEIETRNSAEPVFIR
tara:strand:- start:648 stop:1418 length:771 start_codon:yes stop_codon:yes gene_type:complete